MSYAARGAVGVLGAAGAVWGVIVAEGVVVGGWGVEFLGGRAIGEVDEEGAGEEADAA